MSAQVKWNRLRLSSDVGFRLRNLKGKLGVTPNLLCRLGFIMSLAEPGIPQAESFDEEGPELNRSTLFGEWEQLFDVYLKERLLQDGLDPDGEYLSQLRAHMNRGANMVCNRVRDYSDLLGLVPSQARTAA